MLEYRNWMFNKIETIEGVVTSHTMLLDFLNSVEYAYTLSMDENRYKDGLSLRYLFAYEVGYNEKDIYQALINIPCSTLEMLIALSIRMENDIFADEDYENRTPMWFWKMVRNLGLWNQINTCFDRDYTYSVLYNWFTQNYCPNGAGGLFTITDTNKDMRNYDIWYQVSMYSLEQNRRR